MFNSAKVSAMFIQGARPYGTWYLSRFTNLTAGKVQPVLEVDKVISREKDYIDSINKRKMKIEFSASRISEMYEKAKRLRAEIRMAESLKVENSVKVQTMLRSLKDDTLDTDEIKRLRETGKNLREELRTTTLDYNTVNDELVDMILKLPNTLDPLSPVDTTETIRKVSPAPGIPHWVKPKNLTWEKLPRIGPSREFATGHGSWVELELAAKCQKFLIQNGFTETGNVDFVKRILLEGTGLDPDQFLRIRETKVRSSGVAHATYLVGGASFPAFLALFAQSLIHSPIDCFPFRYFMIGKSYAWDPDGEGTISRSNVQSFIACRDEKEQTDEFNRLVELQEKFYTDSIGMPITTKMVPAPQLRPYESKRFQFVHNQEEEETVVGDVGVVGDYVSKRLLCCYIGSKEAPKFLHVITGKFFNITDILRPSKLEEAKTDQLFQLSKQKLQKKNPNQKEV